MGKTDKSIPFSGEEQRTENIEDGYIKDYISGEIIKNKPEEVQAVQPFSKKLYEDYGYPIELIQTRPQWMVKKSPSGNKKKGYPIDIAVFSDKEHSDDNLYIVVECKRNSGKGGRSQLEDYMRLSKARLGVLYNGKETLYLRKWEGNGQVNFIEIPNIPLYGQRIEDIGLFKRKDLKKTHNLKSVFSNIRNYLAANNIGNTEDTAITSQIINIIFCKIYDERFTRPDDIVKFRAGIDENSKTIADRVKSLFALVKEKNLDVFDRSDEIELTDASVAYIVGELQQYCLSDAERDAISDAFEAFISPSLRGPQGQFFTPRNVVKLLVTLADPSRNDTLLDPACGSGGFLVESLRHVWRKIQEEGKEYDWTEIEIEKEKQEAATKCFKGIDKEVFLSKTAKAYMAILGDGKSGIFCENSLDLPKNWSASARNQIKEETFTIVLTNPPYGSKLRINDKDILSQYELGHKWKKEKDKGSFCKTGNLLSSQTPQTLFVERCFNFLVPGGKMGIVVPESMFCNPSHKYIMNCIERKAQIDAIVSMPEELFQPYTHAKTCAVLITKFQEPDQKIPEDHKIFMAIAEWCGHDSRGLEIPYDDVPLIQERYKDYKEGKTLTYDHLGFIVEQKDIKDSIYLPKYYNPEINKQINKLNEEYDFITIGRLKDEGLISIETGDEVGKINYGTGRIPFIRTSDIANWEIKMDPKQGLNEDIYNYFSEKQDVQPYDILMVKDGTYLVGTCAMVLPGETKIVYQSHLYKIRSLDYDKLDPYLLLAMLSSPIVKKQVRSKQFTQDIIDTLGQRISELALPFPKSETERNRIITSVRSLFEKRIAAKEIMRGVLTELAPIDQTNDDSSFMTII